MDRFLRGLRLLIDLNIKTQNDTLTIHGGHLVAPADWLLLVGCAPHLRHFNLKLSTYADGQPITDIPYLEYLANLETLNIEAPLASLERLADLPKLRSVSVAFNRSVSDVAPLARLPLLEVLHLRSNEIVDISPLSGLGRLQRLDLSDNLIEDLTPLMDLHQLRTLQASGNPVRVAPPMPLVRVMQQFSGVRPPLASFLHLATPAEVDKIWSLLASPQREEWRELIYALADAAQWSGEEVMLYFQAAMHICE